MRLFHPTEPPRDYWRHFASRDEAIVYCAAAWPLREREPDPVRRRQDREQLVQYFTKASEIPIPDPKQTAGFWTVYKHVCSLCIPEARGQLVKKPRSRKPPKYQAIPPIVVACAADAALACAQLYAATQTGLLYDEREKKWEPFGLGYGCLGYYSAQAITYEPPPEIDGRKILEGGRP